MDITAVITAHREGLLAAPSIKSFSCAVANARNTGLTVETLFVLDRPDDVTRAIFEETSEIAGRIVIGDGGDPASTRNLAVQEANGQYIAFLDGDDLWGSNWLREAHAFCEDAVKETIAHSEVNFVFGDQRLLWWHVDSEARTFDPGYLRIGNYWDALIFAKRDILLKYPYVCNDLKAGYGHEDWHWNCVTLAAGIAHRPVPGTIHMKRKRLGSQMAKCAENDVVVRPTEIQNYSWRPAVGQDFDNYTHS